MDTARGVVVSLIEPAAGPDRAVVSVAARDVCRRCAEGRGCGAGIFGRGQRDCRLEVSVPDRLSLDVGQAVTLVIEDRRLLAASALAYGWPLGGIAAGAAVAQVFAADDAGALAGAAAGFAIAAVIARRRLRAPGCLEQVTPRIVD
jgi:sigma-E factor negative regulatory protein RseC